jgi:hypothetical protein
LLFTRTRAVAQKPEVLVDHPLPWLRYVDADDVSAGDIEFDGMKVRNPQMEKLGDVEGFIVDSTSLRPYYVVVDSGGWFKSRDFLVPIGHLTLDDDQDALVVDIPKERISRFPGFDRDAFDRLDADGIRRMNDEICTACSEVPVTYAASDPYSAAWERSDYRQPDWWTTMAIMDRMKAREYVAADDTSTRPLTTETVAYERERITAREADPSPHFDGRAQPGDVIGLETGGERTYLGETKEDENKRREDAVETVEKRKD